MQLKCTSRQDLLRDGFLSWTLDRAHYDSLRHDAVSPHLLVVLLLPDDASAWLEHSPERLILRRCAWWVKMTGMADADTANVTVRLPLDQVFSPDQLRVLMAKVSKGEHL